MCNSGVGLSPVVNGKTHHFAARGLYNGLFLLGDRESGSYWDHITGQCVHGPLKGRQLAVFPLWHMNAGQALANYPDAHLAVSKQTVKQKVMAYFANRSGKSKRGLLPPGFAETMGHEDARRPRMELGLGVWTGATRRFYPLERLRVERNALIDELGGRRLLVYTDPLSDVPAALYTEASRCTWAGRALYLDTGEIVRDGALCDHQGVKREVERPMYVLTRWYGFAYTFPGCDVYEG